VRAAPASREAWGRLALASVPALAARVWNRQGEWATHDPAGIGVRRQSTAAPDAERELFLAWRYQENPPAAELSGGDDRAAGAGPAPDAARRLAGRFARRRGSAPAVVCDDLHRAEDPVAVLHRARAEAGAGRVLVVTPDGAARDPDRPFGPPSDPRSRREWTLDQLELLLLSCGFDVERSWLVRSRPPPGWRGWLAARVPQLPLPGVARDTRVILATPRPGA
jgi:hypothetical protein